MPHRRLMLAAVLTTALSLSVRIHVASAGDEKSKPKFTISKETTYITEPLTKDGYPDYAAAINQRLGKGVTAENNANVMFWRALGPHPERATMPLQFFKLMGIDSLPEDGDYFLNLSEYLERVAMVRPGEKRWEQAMENQGKAMSAPWTRRQYPDIAGWLDANEKPLKLVIAGAKRPRYFSPMVVPPAGTGGPTGLIAVLLPAVQQSRSFARALAARAMLRIREGKTDEAWQDLLTCHRLGRNVGSGACLIEGLVGVAIDAIASEADVAFLQHARPDAKKLAGYIRDLQSLARLPDMAAKVDLCERFMYLDIVMRLYAGREAALGWLGGFEGPDFKPPKKIPFDAVDWDIVLRIGNRWYDRLVEAMQEDDRSQQVAALQKLEKELKALAKKSSDAADLEDRIADADDPKKAWGRVVGTTMVSLLIPAVQQARNAEDRAVQRHRNLLVAFALEAYRSEHGRYPDSLDPLAPKYLKSLPGDLFSGGPLKYRRTKDGYLLYSVGENGRDEGGRSYDDEPRGDDIVVQMPMKSDD